MFAVVPVVMHEERGWEGGIVDYSLAAWHVIVKAAARSLRNVLEMLLANQVRRGGKGRQNSAAPARLCTPANPDILLSSLTFFFCC